MTTPPLDRPRNTTGLISEQRLVPRAVRLFRPYRTQVSVVGVLILLTAGLGVVNPALIKFVFENALFPEERGPDLGLLWIIASVMAAIAIGNGIMGGSPDLRDQQGRAERDARPS